MASTYAHSLTHTQPDEPVPDSRRLKRTFLLAMDGADADGPPPSKSGVLIPSWRTSAVPPASMSTYFPRLQRPDISRGATRMPFQALVPNSIVGFGA